MGKGCKNLNLHRDILIDKTTEYLKSKFNRWTVSDLIPKGNVRRRIDIIAEDKTFFVDFHFNGDGTTTIEDFGGKNIEVKKELINYLKEKCLIGNQSKDTWFVVKNIEREDFEAIIELLCESEYALKDSNLEKEEQNDRCIYRLKGVYNENLVITYYDTKKVQVQGKVLLLFQEAISMFSELVDDDKISEVYNNFYEIKVDKVAVQEKFDIYMCHALEYLPQKLKRCIKQAIYYTVIDADMFDYSAIPITAFRALEGHMKYAFKDLGIYTSKEQSVGSLFYKEGRNFKLKDVISDSIENKKKVASLEEAYTTYNKRRHILSHWDDLEEGSEIDTTKIIESMPQAREYIIDTLQIINTYYNL